MYLKCDENNKVTFTHYKPFDLKHGLGKTEEELLEEGILVDELPTKPEPVVGKKNLLYINPLRWEYVDRPLTQKEKLNQMVEDGILTQEQADDLLNK